MLQTEQVSAYANDADAIGDEMENELTRLQAYMDKLKPNVIVRGPLFPEPVQIITTLQMGGSIKIFGSGLSSNQTYQPVLSIEQLATLEFTPEDPTTAIEVYFIEVKAGPAWAK